MSRNVPPRSRSLSWNPRFAPVSAFSFMATLPRDQHSTRRAVSARVRLALERSRGRRAAAADQANQPNHAIEYEPQHEERAEGDDCGRYAPRHGKRAVPRIAASLQIGRRFDGGNALLELRIDIVIGVVPAEASADDDPDGGKDNKGTPPEAGFSHGRSLAREPRRQGCA